MFYHPRGNTKKALVTMVCHSLLADSMSFLAIEWKTGEGK